MNTLEENQRDEERDMARRHAERAGEYADPFTHVPQPSIEDSQGRFRALVSALDFVYDALSKPKPKAGDVDDVHAKDES